MTAWCLFEQSGTFKNAFKEFGFEAYDCDILDDFKQTNFKVDLFDEILKTHNALFDSGGGALKILFLKK